MMHRNNGKRKHLREKHQPGLSLLPARDVVLKKNKGIKVVQDVEVVTDVHTDTIIEFSDINIQTY